jgi:hypothetical protein
MKLILPLLFALSAPLLQAQILGNPGFESEWEGWKVEEKLSPPELTGEAAHSGKSGLRITTETEGNGVKITSDPIEVSPGQKLSLRFQARSSRSALAAVMLVPQGADKRPLFNELGKPPVFIGIRKSDDWESYEAQYLVPGEAVAVSLWIRSWSKAAAIVDFDDFELNIE